MDTLTKNNELEVAREQTKLYFKEEAWKQLEKELPFSLGSEYINVDWTNHIFEELHHIFQQEIKEYPNSVKLYLAEKNQNLRVPERIFFHLVENKDDEYPFAFLATYATKDKDGTVRHMPLRYALEEYKGDRDCLVKLLSCLNQAAKTCELLSSLIEQGELFHTLRFTSKEAYELLTHIEEIEACGILCRIPNWWRKKYANISLTMKIGDKKPSLLGFDSLLSLKPEFSVDGVVLSEQEVKKLLMQSEGLAFLKGKWIEVNHEKLRRLLQNMEQQKQKEITMFEALRSTMKEDSDNGVTLSNGQWFQQFLQDLRAPKKQIKTAYPKSLNATLRSYQEIGFAWLSQMNRYGFGACLADDMGLGKTIQVLSFLESFRLKHKQACTLLIVPASLLGNW